MSSVFLRYEQHHEQESLTLLLIHDLSYGHYDIVDHRYMQVEKLLFFDEFILTQQPMRFLVFHETQTHELVYLFLIFTPILIISDRMVLDVQTIRVH